MARNPSPKVAAARDYCRKFGREMVVIISFPSNLSQYEIVSYGKTRDLCNNAKTIADELEKAVRDLETPSPRPKKTLPQTSALGGVDPDFTGDMSTEAYIRSLRDD